MRLAGLEAEEHLVGLGILPVQVVAVIGGHEGEPQLPCQFQEPPVRGRLLRQGVFLEFEIVAVPERVRIPLRRGPGLLHPVPEAVRGNLSLEAGGEGDEPFAVLRQDLLVDAGLVVEPLLEADGNEA